MLCSNLDNEKSDAGRIKMFMRAAFDPQVATLI